MCDLKSQSIYISLISISFTYGHRLQNTRYPVRSAIFNLKTGDVSTGVGDHLGTLAAVCFWSFFFLCLWLILFFSSSLVFRILYAGFVGLCYGSYVAYWNAVVEVCAPNYLRGLWASSQIGGWRYFFKDIVSTRTSFKIFLRLWRCERMAYSNSESRIRRKICRCLLSMESW